MAVDRLWKSQSDFQGAVGAIWASTAPAPSTASGVRRGRPLAEPITLPNHLHARS